MKIRAIIFASCAVAMMAATSSVHAGQCEGFSSRKYEKPVVIKKSKDGSKVLHISSTGVTNQTAPSKNTSWQHCTGFWNLNADKSGSGSGNCLAMDTNGDQRILLWEGSAAKGKKSSGTWKKISGTGKYASGGQVKGTWKSGLRFADGHRITDWTGECAD